MTANECGAVNASGEPCGLPSRHPGMDHRPRRHTMSAITTVDDDRLADTGDDRICDLMAAGGRSTHAAHTGGNCWALHIALVASDYNEPMYALTVPVDEAGLAREWAMGLYVADVTGEHVWVGQREVIHVDGTFAAAAARLRDQAEDMRAAYVALPDADRHEGASL